MNLLSGTLGRTAAGAICALAVLLFLIVRAGSGESATSGAPSLIVNTEAFQVIDDADAAADVVMKFGEALNKTLTYERTAGRFRFNDDLSVAGSISGSSLTIDNLTTSGGILYSRGTNPSVAQTAAGASGQLLISQGADAPEWKTPIISMVWHLGGTQSVGTQKGAVVVMPFGFTLYDVFLYAHGAPTGDDLIVDIKENGSTIFSTKPQIDASANYSTTGHAFSDTELSFGNLVSVSVDQVGSTFAGSGLTINLYGARKY